MNDKIKEIKFIEYNGIEGYIELMKHDVEPLNNPKCKSIELYYNGKDIKVVLDYITNLQQENERLKAQVTLLEDNRLFLNKKIGQAIKSLKQECMFLEEWHYDGYDPQLEIIIDLLEADE